jgi:hypothetical protein
MNPLSLSPFPTLYGSSALDLVIQHFVTMAVREVDQVLAWLLQVSNGLKEGDLREPTIRFTFFENHIRTLLEVATGTPNLSAYAPDFDSVELEDIAALLAAATLMRRQYLEGAPVSTSQAGEVAATRRGWSVVKDAVDTIWKHVERLDILGAAVLSSHPDLLEEWRTYLPGDGFVSAAEELRRRLDFIQAREALFANSAAAASFVEGEALLTDAWDFYRGREGRRISRVQLTLGRDIAFTLLLHRVERLQHVLKAAYFDNRSPEMDEKLNGKHWKTLSRISRPRRKKAGAAKEPKKS